MGSIGYYLQIQRHLYGRDIQRLKTSLVTDHDLGQYIRYAFILHDS